MKENNELEKEDLCIGREMDVDCDSGQEIICYIETWFDVDKKFCVDTAADDDTWLNMYGRYNPYEDTLRIECEISRPDSSSYFDYTQTKAEDELIKKMITQKIKEKYDQTPQELCEEVCDTCYMMGGIR